MRALQVTGTDVGGTCHEVEGRCQCGQSRLHIQLEYDTQTCAPKAESDTFVADLCQRFNVRGYPTVLLFSKGKQYKFQSKRTLDELEKFARGGYLEAKAETTPKAPSAVGAVQKGSSVANRSVSC